MGSAALLRNPEIHYIPVEKIRTNPYQPRKFFEKSLLEDLAASIKEYGVIQPVTVRLINGNYELVAGERRLRASKLAGLETIPAAVVSVSDCDGAIVAMIENLQRQDLNFLEEAEGFQNLIADYGFTQERLAQKMGKSQSSIANKLRILKLSRTVQKILIENNLTERHARALLKLDSEESQIKALKKIVGDDLTVKKTDELIEQMLSTSPLLEEKPRVRLYIKDIRLFTNTIKQAVEIMNLSGIKTEYDIEEMSDGCFISILVNY